MTDLTATFGEAPNPNMFIVALLVYIGGLLGGLLIGYVLWKMKKGSLNKNVSEESKHNG